MKVNKFGMLIKFAAFYLCVNFIVVSAIPVNEPNLDNKKAASVEATDTDYDAISVDKSTEASNSGDTKPPLVFPVDDKTTSKNDTALEILQKNSNTSVVNENSTAEKKEASHENSDKDKDYDEKESVTDKKVDDVQKEPKSVETTEQPKTEVVKKNETKEETADKDYEEPSSNEDSGDEKTDVENIQEVQEDQGGLEERYGVNSTSINVFEEPTLNGSHYAFIFATLLVFLSVTAYVGLILWRKSLEYRYGMRQRLVTEDDYYNNNDVRFFGL